MLNRGLSPLPGTHDTATPVAIDGGVALYFVDIYKLNQPTPQIIYRATSVDGVNFDKATPAYTQSGTMVDPFVLRMPDGSFRVYVPSDYEGIISATSSDASVCARRWCADDIRQYAWGAGVARQPSTLLSPF